MEATGSSQQVVCVDWSDLPADLVAAVSKKLHDLFDFVYFRAVCKNWRMATSISDLPPQFPWIVERREDVGESAGEYLRFYSLISGKTRTVHCPKSRGKHLSGPSHGYLYSTDSDQMCSLLNPLTNDEMIVEFERQFCGYKVCMNVDQKRRDNYIVFKSANYYPEKMGIYELRNREWYYVQHFPWSNNYLGFACLKGFYYTINTFSTVVLDIASGSSFSVPSPDIFHLSDNVYFVAESAGKVLLIVMLSCKSNYAILIYQLDVIDKNCGYRWVKTRSIGDQILFLDCDGGISIAACETTGLRGNSIYHLQSCYDINFKFSKCELYRYNIEDNRREKICSHFDRGKNWFVPCITGSLSVGLH